MSAARLALAHRQQARRRHAIERVQALGEQESEKFDGGSLNEAKVDVFPVSERLAGALLELEPGGLRELHWHASYAEWA